MNDYILLQARGAKIKLKSKRTTSGMCRVRFGNHRTVEFSVWHEAEMCTLVYTEYFRPEVAMWLTDIFEDIGPDEIDDFYIRFKKSHPLIPVEYRLEDIKCIADDTTYCELHSPLFQHPIKMTKEHEQTLLNLITNRYVDRGVYDGWGDAPSVGAAIQSFFAWYRSNYGICTKYKKDRAHQDYELLYHFCIVHGIDLNYVQTAKVRLSFTNIVEGVGWGYLAIGGFGVAIFLFVLLLIGICKLL